MLTHPINLLTALLLFTGTLSAAPTVGPPAPEREFRGAWVATVANIDWPSRPGLPAEVQQKELVALIERAAELHFNAILFQVRPAADAVYASKLEPWSEFLTGAMGKAPEPFYDPLTLAIDEAHRRGLELHAWFNPYRASHPQEKEPVAPNHVSNTLPGGVLQYGKYLWLDPGAAAAVDHSLNVILDVVRRYDIDGVHFDDYFYPYPIKDQEGKMVPFPDDRSWRQAQKEGPREAGNKLDRNDWRRQNVNRFVERVYRQIKQEKPWVKFGISPFGIWQPGVPKTIQGFNAYASLYADSRKWIREGWLDYLAPQLYWKVESKGQSFPVLLQWWCDQNLKHRHLWPGLFTSRVGLEGKRLWPAAEVLRQVEITRQQPGATGNIHFSFQAIQKNQGQIADMLASGPYAEEALVPASPWLGAKPPPKPILAWEESDGGQDSLRLRLPDGARPWWWSVQWRHGDRWQLQVVSGQQDRITLDRSKSQGPLEQVAVTAISRTGVAGPVVVLSR